MILKTKSIKMQYGLYIKIYLLDICLIKFRQQYEKAFTIYFNFSISFMW